MAAITYDDIRFHEISLYTLAINLQEYLRVRHPKDDSDIKVFYNIDNKQFIGWCEVEVDWGYVHTSDFLSVIKNRNSINDIAMLIIPWQEFYRKSMARATTNFPKVIF